MISLWPAIPAAIFSLGAAYIYHNIIIDNIKSGYEDKIEAIKKEKDEICKKEKEITRQTEEAYVKSISDLNKRVATLKLRKPTCIPLPTSQPTGSPDGRSPKGLLGPVGFSTEFLYDFAADADRASIQVKSLQSFIRETWKLNGQDIP